MAPFLIAGALVYFAVHLLMDVEYAGQDVTVRGPRVFSWARGLVGKPALSADQQPVRAVRLFAQGTDSIDPRTITQGAVYDCRFLAELSSFARTPKGRECIKQMIRQNADGTYTVTFPGPPPIPITVTPLTAMELKLYGKTPPNNNDIWLPVLEKAYGEYRITHQDALEHVFRTLKHGIFEWRWTSRPELPGFGASYGAKDDLAAVLLSGHNLRRVPTVGVEIGEFGLAKGYVNTRQMRSWLNRDAVVAEIIGEQERLLKQAHDSDAIITATTEVAASEAQGLFSNHAYAILDYDPEKRELLIRDVMSKCDFVDPATGKVRDGRADGVFVLNLAEFNKYFSHVNVGEP